jgi:hypothetical protein
MAHKKTDEEESYLPTGKSKKPRPETIPAKQRKYKATPLIKTTEATGAVKKPGKFEEIVTTGFVKKPSKESAFKTGLRPKTLPKVNRGR